MTQLVETASTAVNAIHQQKDKPLVQILEELEEVQEHLEKAIDAVQDNLCEED